MDELVSRYHAKLLDFIYRHLGDRDTAADITQATFIRVFKSANCYESRASFKTWLYTIALNQMRDELRKKKVRKESSVEDVTERQLHSMAHIDEITPEEFALNQVFRSSIWSAVNRLPDNYRTAILLKFRQQLTYVEIAEVMNTPVGTVKSWIHYGLKSLKSCLEPQDCEA
jgi:RNA polymerase sigma-70 factor (ECF subfamily)